MSTMHKPVEVEARWVFAALVGLGLAITITLFNGLQFG